MLDEILEANESYAASFTKGDLPAPPDAVFCFSAPAHHADVVKLCAARGIPVMGDYGSRPAISDLRYGGATAGGGPPVSMITC